MQIIHTPKLGFRYWGLLCIASVAGAGLGDFVSRDLHGGHWRGLAPIAVVLAAILFGERRSKVPTEIYYWSAIIIVRTAATNLADLATHDGKIPYGYAVSILAVLLALLVGLTGRRNESAGTLPQPGGAYWLGMLLAGTLGTAAGDGVADALGLGVQMGTALLGAVTAVLLALRAWPAAATTMGYWVTVVSVRAAGTTLGDWGSHTVGLERGTLCSCTVFVACYVLSRRSEAVTVARLRSMRRGHVVER